MKLCLLNKKSKIKGLHDLEFKSVDFRAGNAANPGVELVLVVEIVEELGCHHDAADEEPR